VVLESANRRFRRVVRRRGGKFLDSSAWRDDNETGGQSWIDVPGRLVIDGPDDFPAQRTLQEFVWGVANWQCFKYLYYIVVTDTKPGFYRNRVSQAIPIDKATYKEIMKNGAQPYKNEDQVGFAADSTWLPVQDVSQPQSAAAQAK
jgi:hypothetical protein